MNGITNAVSGSSGGSQTVTGVISQGNVSRIAFTPVGFYYLCNGEIKAETVSNSQVEIQVDKGSILSPTYFSKPAEITGGITYYDAAENGGAFAGTVGLTSNNGVFLVTGDFTIHF